MLSKEYLLSIKPKGNKRSDKYSWNLYIYLKNNPNVQLYERGGVYFFLSRYNGGYMGDSVNSILTKLNHHYSWDKDYDFTEIPEFFKEYQKVGRCYFFDHDYPWLRNDSKRFTYVNKHSRKCNWCGKWFSRKIETRKTIERREVWKEI